MIRTIVVAVLIGAALLGGPAHAGMHSLEDAIEGSTFSLSLPTTEGGSMVVRTCSSCPPVMLRVDAKSRLFIGGQQVTLAELNGFLSDGNTRGVTVLYDKKSLKITRIVVDGTIPKPRAGGRN